MRETVQRLIVEDHRGICFSNDRVIEIPTQQAIAIVRQELGFSPKVEVDEVGVMLVTMPRYYRR